MNLWKSLFGRKSQSKATGPGTPGGKNILVMVVAGDCRGNDHYLQQLENKDGVSVSVQSLDDRDFRLDMLGKVLEKNDRDGHVLGKIIFVGNDEYTRRIASATSRLVKSVVSLEEAVKQAD